MRKVPTHSPEEVLAASDGGTPEGLAIREKVSNFVLQFAAATEDTENDIHAKVSSISVGIAIGVAFAQLKPDEAEKFLRTFTKVPNGFIEKMLVGGDPDIDPTTMKVPMHVPGTERMN